MMRPYFLTFALILTSVSGPIALAGGEFRMRFLLDDEPGEIPEPSIMFIDPGLVPMWKRALSQPESELKRQAAEAVVQLHRLGHDEGVLADPELLAVLDDDKTHPAARYAAARALIVLDRREASGKLLEVSQSGDKDLRQLVEPVLAEWNVEAIQPVWHQRLSSSATPRRELVLAIEGLGTQRDAAALPALMTLALNAERSADIRLAAARAAGQIATQGLEPQAEQLIARGKVIDRLTAASLITRHKSPESVSIHQQLGVDAEPAVAGAALRSLFAMDPTLVLPVAEAALQSPDANVRQVGIDTYLALPTKDRILRLSQSFNDPHPRLRTRVRDGFFTLSKVADLNQSIRQSATAVLIGEDWRGQEQAALLLGELDEEPAAGRLIELLDSRRAEVMLSAAWSLRKLEIPSTARPVLEFATRRSTESDVATPTSSRQLAHLFELLGQLKFRDAIPLLEGFVPKTQDYGAASRAAAIWSLGVIDEGTTNEELAKKLIDRVQDILSIPPEAAEVRRAAVLSLGRIRAADHVEVLKQHLGETVDQDLMELTLRRAIHQMTGELLPIQPPPRVKRGGWFLEPIEPVERATQSSD